MGSQDNFYLNFESHQLILYSKIKMLLIYDIINLKNKIQKSACGQGHKSLHKIMILVNKNFYPKCIIFVNE